MGLLLTEESEGQSWSKVELLMVELLILVISRDSCVESPVEDNYVISECEGDSLREKVGYITIFTPDKVKIFDAETARIQVEEKQ